MVFFLKYIQHDKIRTVFEVGARDCLDTIALAHHYPNAIVYSYECNPNTTPLCKERLYMMGTSNCNRRK